MTREPDLTDAALILVDVQEGFRDPWWGRSHELETAYAKIARLGREWNARGLPVVKVRHDSQNPESPLYAGSSGNRFVTGVASLREDVIVTKTVNSAFLGTPDLAEWLRARGISTIVVAGVQTNACVETTARMGGNLGFSVVVPLDATATFDLEGPALAGNPPIRLSAEDLMRATAVSLHGGGFAHVTEVSTILSALEEKS
ncbi:cysteine hydrolase family protein [Zhihengliuella salsuginis]|uniref:Hydrolase n=1 Tax=Zhihengliuella salsuginis TaxID=578222 RepID=A0ABQ3GGT7_9MICC|nr:cysteine hydrolase family protein [Zhihengliuella salsuginis]GHD05614.1 hydrolase [Zhihengliuella salsuginis]